MNLEGSVLDESKFNTKSGQLANVVYLLMNYHLKDQRWISRIVDKKEEKMDPKLVENQDTIKEIPMDELSPP